MKKRLFILMTMATICAMSISASEIQSAPKGKWPFSVSWYPKLPVYPTHKDAKYPLLSWPNW